MRLAAVTVQIVAVAAQVALVSAQFVTVTAQLGIVLPQFAMFPGDARLVALAPLVTQLMKIPITFARIPVSITAILTEVTAVVVQVFPVAAHLAVRRLRRFVGGINGRYRRQRQDGGENEQIRFTREACSPDVGLRNSGNYFQVPVVPGESAHRHG